MTLIAKSFNDTIFPEEGAGDDDEQQRLSETVLNRAEVLLLDTLPFHRLVVKIKRFVRGLPTSHSESRAIDVPTWSVSKTWQTYQIRIQELLQPPWRPQLKLVRWTCTCGARMWEDFPHLEEDGRMELEEAFESYFKANTTVTPHSGEYRCTCRDQTFALQSNCHIWRALRGFKVRISI